MSRRLLIKPRALCVVLLAMAFAGTVPLRRVMDSGQGVRENDSQLFTSSGQTMRRLALGYDGLLADIYWTRAVQYYGRQRLNRAHSYALLGPLLRVTTALDPHLLIAYRFGAIFLAERPPEGAGQPEEALALLRRGIVANPDYWRLWQDLGFIYYWDLKDYPSAARAFETGGGRPGAELWMKAMAASIAAKGGEKETSWLLWSEIYRQAENNSIRRSALAHLVALKAEAEMRELDGLLAKYLAREGRDAASFGELVKAGMLRSEPVDPSGAPYGIGSDGRAALAASSGVQLRLVK